MSTAGKRAGKQKITARVAKHTCARTRAEGTHTALYTLSHVPREFAPLYALGGVRAPSHQSCSSELACRAHPEEMIKEQTARKSDCGAAIKGGQSFSIARIALYSCRCGHVPRGKYHYTPADPSSTRHASRFCCVLHFTLAALVLLYRCGRSGIPLEGT